MPRQNITTKFQKIIRLLDEALDKITQQCFKRAKNILNNILRLQPNYANAYYLLSVCHSRLGQNNEHDKIKQQAYNLNPVFYQNYQNNEQKILKKIQNTFTSSKILQINFSQIEGEQWGELINIFFNAKDLQTCYLLIRLYQQLDIQNQNKTSYQFSTMGIAYYQIALYNQSLLKYIQAIQIRNQMYFYYNNCAIIKYITKDYTKGLQFINKSLQIKPRYPRTFFIQSFCLTKLGMLDTAMDKLKQVINQCPNSVHYRLKRVTNLFLYFSDKAEQIKSDLKIITQIINQGEDSDSYFMCQSNIPLIRQSSNFLLKYIQNKSINKKYWTQYVNYLDDYLIHGHLDKYRLSKKMSALMMHILDDLFDKNQKVDRL